MRTLKKSLALVLAVVMVLGLCMISANAFTDDAEIKNEEAVAVLSGIGVIQGNSDGSFNPAGTLTREQAAAFIARLKGEGDLKASSSFEDVKGRWSEGNVAFCASQGIVNGVGNGLFNPTGTLTGEQWGKMLLVAMGFDSAAEGLDKADTWQVAVARLVRAKKLDDSIKGIDLTQPITREQACVMAFNAMQQSVSGETVYTVDGSDLTFDEFIMAFLASGSDVTKVHTATPDDSMMKNFEKLSRTTETDEFGRPGYQWVNGDKTLYENYTAGTKVSAAKLDGKEITAANLQEALNNKKLEGDPTIIINGVEVASADFVAGDEIEAYTSKNTLTKVVITRYTFAQVGKTTDLKKAEKVEGDPSTKKIALTLIDGSTLSVRDAFFADYDYAEKDFVLVALKGAEVLASKAASTVSGKIDATKGAQYRINGSFYSVAASTFDIVTELKKESTWALDAAGALAATVVTDDNSGSKSTDYALVYNVVEVPGSSKGSNEDGYDNGSTDATYNVYFVKTDGTKDKLQAYADKKVSMGGLSIVGEQETVVAYTVKDGKFLVTVGAYEIKSATVTKTKTQSKIADGAYANSSTLFIKGAKNVEKNTYEVSVLKGYTTTELKNADVVYVANKSTVLYVFTGANIAAQEDVKKASGYAVLVSETPVITVDDDNNNIYSYDVIIDGKDAELKSAAPITTVAAGQVFEYETENGYVSDATALTAKVKVDYVDGNQVVIEGVADVYSQANAKVYAFDQDGAIAEGELKAGQTIILIADKQNIVYAFIDYVAPEE
ncbi:MAG: S-layer homology domain-containing protein [Oscillospiraceae bacterium]|nr:S-layer homology domain-containing protein [Oscillospiraceae bacterium]